MTLGVTSHDHDRPATEEEINLQIGRRIRRRRRIRGMTQQKLASQLGIQFQQIQKYECASNRVYAARLFRMAEALQVPIQYFFDSAAGAPANDRDCLDNEEMTCGKEARELVDAYFRLADPVRRKLREFAKVLGEGRG